MAKADPKLATKWGQALAAAGVDFTVKKGKQPTFVLTDNKANVLAAQGALTASAGAGWSDLVAQHAKGYAAITAGDIRVEFAPIIAPAATGPRSPEQLVADFEAETAQARRPEDEPSTLPSGKALLALDRVEQVAAAVALYQSLPTVRAYSEPQACKEHLLGSLALALFRVKLPLTEADALAMLAGLLAFAPSYDTRDFDKGLVMGLSREPGPPTPKVEAALRTVMAQRRASDPHDRSKFIRAFMASCEKLLARPPVAPAAGKKP